MNHFPQLQPLENTAVTHVVLLLETEANHIKGYWHV